MDRGQARENRSLLLSCDDHGTTILDFLADGRFDDAQTLTGKGSSKPRIHPRPLSPEARASRKPQSPVELAEASGERIHKEGGKLIKTLTGRISGKK
jgi:hypothetical protein